MCSFGKFKEQFPSKKKFYSLLTGKKNSDKKCEHFLKIWYIFQMKTMKDYHDLYLKCHFLLLADVFGKFINNSLWNYGYVQVIKLECNAQYNKS